MVTDRDAPGDARLTIPTAVTVDHRGRLYAAEAGAQPARILVFDSSGVPAEVFGSRGDGPGEFRAAAPPIVTPEGELMTFDAMARKVVFLNDDLGFDREVRLPFAPRLPLEGGRLLVHHHVPEPDRVGHGFHVMTESGVIERSFGGSGPLDPEQPWLFFHTFAVGPDGLLWTTPSEAQLDLRLLDPRDGSEVRALPTSWPHFQPMKPGLGRDARRFPATSSVQGLIPEPEQGLLWLLIQTPRSDWRPSRDPSVPIPVEEEVTHEDRVAAFLWVVLAVDDMSGEILAERELETPHFVSPGNDFLTSWGRLEGDDVVIPLVRPRLEQGG